MSNETPVDLGKKNEGEYCCPTLRSLVRFSFSFNHRIIINGITEHSDRELGWCLHHAANDALRGDPDVLVTGETELAGRLRRIRFRLSIFPPQ